MSDQNDPSFLRAEDIHAVAQQGSVAVGSIQVGGDVHGDIIIGHHNFKVNTNYGTIEGRGDRVLKAVPPTYLILPRGC